MKRQPAHPAGVHSRHLIHPCPHSLPLKHAAAAHDSSCWLVLGLGGGRARLVLAMLLVHPNHVATLAPPGEILVSRTVKDLLAGSAIRFTRYGTHQLTEAAGEWPLFAVAGQPETE